MDWGRVTIKRGIVTATIPLPASKSTSKLLLCSAVCFNISHIIKYYHFDYNSISSLVSAISLEQRHNPFEVLAEVCPLHVYLPF